MAKKFFMPLYVLAMFVPNMLLAASPGQVFVDTAKGEAQQWGIGAAIFLICVVTGIFCVKERSLMPAIWALVGGALLAMGPNIGPAMQTWFGAVVF